MRPDSKLSTVYAFKGGSDGAYPESGLAVSGKNLYGTSTGGGKDNTSGTVYELSPVTNGYKKSILYKFQAQADGDAPQGALYVDSHGAVYGTTFAGGVSACRCGTVYRLTHTAKGWKKAILYSFQNGTDGANPRGGVVADSSGALYGVTTSGGQGACNCGVLYKLTPSGSAYKQSVLREFSGGGDGSAPFAQPAIAGTTLYGTTSTGGTVTSLCTSGCGTIYQISTTGKNYKVIYRFGGGSSDGSNPQSALVPRGNGGFFGVTTTGGNVVNCAPYGCGTIFTIAPAKGVWKESVLAQFAGYPYNGQSPSSPPLYYNGALYGATQLGGTTSNSGTFYKAVLGPAKATIQTMYAFAGSSVDPSGNQPNADLVQLPGHAFAGVTLYGGGHNTCPPNGCGLVYGFVP